jgi:hypothetical protein
MNFLSKLTLYPDSWPIVTQVPEESPLQSFTSRPLALVAYRLELASNTWPGYYLRII